MRYRRDASSLRASAGRPTAALVMPLVAALNCGGSTSQTPTPAKANAAFSAACPALAAVYGRSGCQACVQQSMQDCGSLYSTMEDVCGPQYLCVASCLCPTPCDTSGFCSCAEGCLPVENTDCTALMTKVAICVSAPCAGTCSSDAGAGS
jgi:hypothetical protein